MTRSEKWIVGALAVLSILMFFFPILTISVPIAGTRSHTGYDVVINSRGINDVTDKLPSGEPSSSKEEKSYNIPLSVRFAYLIHIFIAVAFLAAALTIIGTFFSRQLARVASALGAISGLLAVIHVKIANSDIHSFFSEQLAGLENSAADNPFAGLADGLAKLFVSGINLAPGTGLYVLTACLAITVVLINTRVVARVTLSPPEVNVETPETTAVNRIAQIDTACLAYDRVFRHSVKARRFDEHFGKVTFDVDFRKGIRYSVIGPAGDKYPGEVLIHVGGYYFLVKETELQG